MFILNNFLIIYGGFTVSSILDPCTYISNINNLKANPDLLLKWEVIKTDIFPMPRCYFAGAVCKSGKAKNAYVLFGGRNEEKKLLNDIWALVQHTDGHFSWKAAPTNDKSTAIPRYLHTCVFYKNNLVIIGGLGDKLENMFVEIYDANTSAWLTMPAFNKFRHSSVIIDKYTINYGGCSFEDFENSTDDLVVFDLEKMMSNKESLNKQKIYRFEEQAF